MRRRRNVERDEVLPPAAHIRLAAWRAEQGDAPSTWLAEYRQQQDAARAQDLARLRDENKELRMRLEETIDARYARATTALRAAGAGLVLLGLMLASAVTPALAQYTPEQLRELQAPVLSIGEEVRGQYPAAWRAAHNAGEPQGSEYVRRWALALRARGITACVNGKRGSDTLSQDVLVFPVTANGNRDTSGQYAQIAIVDVIGGAGGPSPSLGWNDVSAASQGKCIAPFLETAESGAAPPVTPAPPTPAPAPAFDWSPVTTRLDAIERRLSAIEQRPDPAPPDTAALSAFVDDMVGQGPGDDPAVTPNHVTDIKQRVDAVRLLLEQLNGWLRSRAVLRVR